MGWGHWIRRPWIISQLLLKKQVSNSLPQSSTAVSHVEFAVSVLGFAHTCVIAFPTSTFEAELKLRPAGVAANPDAGNNPNKVEMTKIFTIVSFIRPPLKIAFPTLIPNIKARCMPFDCV
jgi:hypothetical protein